MQISLETFMTGQFLQSRNVHQFACFLKTLTFDILFGLDCSLSGDPSLYELVYRNDALPLLFRTLLLFLVGLTERNFGIRQAVSLCGGFVGVTGLGCSEICASSSSDRQGIAD
jgi:hypothetical protein